MNNLYKIRNRYLEDLKGRMRKYLMFLENKQDTPETRERFFRHICDTISKDPNMSDEEKQLQLYIFKFTFSLTIYFEMGKVEHLYIGDDALVNFLENTKIKDLNIFKRFCNKYKDKPLCIHTHNDMIIIHFDGNLGEYILGVMSQLGIFYVSCEETKEDINKKEKGIRKVVRFLVNLLSYIDAFPSTIEEGLPADMCKSQRQVVKETDNKVLGMENRLLCLRRGEVTPHFRTGHFVTFKHDRYTKMKGKTIFVEATIVHKDKAKKIDKKGEQNEQN